MCSLDLRRNDFLISRVSPGNNYLLVYASCHVIASRHCSQTLEIPHTLTLFLFFLFLALKGDSW